MGGPRGMTVLKGTMTLDGTTSVELQDFTLAGGVSAVNATNPILFGDSVSSTVTLNGGSNAEIVHDSFSATASLTLTGSASSPMVEFNQIAGSLSFTGSGAASVEISGNTFTTGSGGITIAAPSSGDISNSDVSAAAVALTITSPFSGTIQNNSFHSTSRESFIPPPRP